jgi:hypothetical protein
LKPSSAKNFERWVSSRPGAGCWSLALLKAWFTVIRGLACLGLALAKFSSNVMFITLTGNVLVLPVAPFVVVGQAYYSDTCTGVSIGE